MVILLTKALSKTCQHVIEISYDVGGRKRLSSKKAKKFGQILLVNSSELLTGIGTSTIVSSSAWRANCFPLHFRKTQSLRVCRVNLFHKGINCLIIVCASHYLIIKKHREENTNHNLPAEELAPRFFLRPSPL